MVLNTFTPYYPFESLTFLSSLTLNWLEFYRYYITKITECTENNILVLTRVYNTDKSFLFTDGNVVYVKDLIHNEVLIFTVFRECHDCNKIPLCKLPLPVQLLIKQYQDSTFTEKGIQINFRVSIQTTTFCTPFSRTNTFIFHHMYSPSHTKRTVKKTMVKQKQK